MSQYNNSSIFDLSTSTPIGEIDSIRDLDDSLRQVKRFFKEQELGSLVNLLYPIGCLFLSFTSDTPSTTLQTRFDLASSVGTWAKLEEVTVVAHKESSTEFGTVTLPAASGEDPDYGEKAHVLTEAEMAAHTHTETRRQYVGVAFGTAQTGIAKLSPNNIPTPQEYDTSSVGADNPHNNIQPSRTVYMWARIA